jgi:hypothetical protein
MGAQTPEINIIPKPTSMRLDSGSFTVNSKTKIVAVGDSGQRLAGLLNDFLFRNYRFKLVVTDQPQAKDAIQLFWYSRKPLNEPDFRQSYTLSIDKNLVTINGSETGIFLGSRRYSSLFL